jgi:hypothetical protein
MYTYIPIYTYIFEKKLQYSALLQSFGCRQTFFPPITQSNYQTTLRVTEADERQGRRFLFRF